MSQDISEIEEKLSGGSLGSVVNREELAGEFLPDKNDWPAKTILRRQEPQLIATALILTDMYPEIAHLDPIIDEFIEVYLKSRTSLGGTARQEYKDILMSAFGVQGEAQGGQQELLRRLLETNNDSD